MKNGRCLTGWLAAGLLLGLAGSVWAQQMAPVNPAFARWQRERAAKEAEGKKGPETARPRAARAAAARGEAGGEDMDFGFVPTVLDMGYLSNLNDNLAQGVGDVLEPAYDLREAGALTAVRDQGSYGNCGAFAAMGSLESWVKKSEGTELDLSENHLVNLHGWSQGFGAGGNAQMAEGYFLRWAGPVAESEDAYPRPGKSVAGTPVRHVQRVRWIPGKTAYLDNDGIKQALKSWGALQADYYHAGSYYNAKTAAYYFNPGTSYRLSNHAVDLVGWDDNYSKKNFKPEPPGDGAYIVRNSWGSGWGEGGYFHISYYDESFAWKPLYSFSGTEAADNYDAVYQHDPLGMVGAIGYAGPTAWGANVFTAAEASKVAAAGFYAMTPRTTYTLMVYTGCRAGSPRSGTLAAQQSGTVDAAGYVTVPLETPAAVSAGQRFSVVVQLTTPGYAYPLAVEYAVAGYSAAASAKEGESYLSANGSKWDDFTARVSSTANFCCKAYVKSAAVVRSLAGLSIEGVNSLKAGSSADFTCTAAYSDGSTKAVSPRWSIAEGGKWASVDSSGRVTAKATGEQRTVKLRASYSEGGVSKTAEWSFFVTVAAPAAPADLEATAGTEESCVRLSWTASEGAAGYAVYRGTRESSGNAAYLGTVTATRYADTAAVPGVDYRYFVKAKNGSGSSPFSPGAWGWRALAAPANLSASDGTRDDRVDVAWNRSEGASHYRVWRADGEDGEPVAVSPWQTACQYADTTAEAGMPHLYYATAAVDADGTRESAFGVPDEGFRTGPPVLKTLEISGPVSLVSGGRGTYTCTAVSTDGTRTAVAPEWTLSGGSLAVSDGKAVVTAPVAGENTTVTLTAAYSDGTASRTGRLVITVTPAVPPAPAALELVSATERGIALRWSAVANATSYQLWRSGPGEDSAVVASTTATEHTDASAAPGVAYAYRVGAANAAGAGAPGGAVVEAVRPVAAPTGVSASYGTYADKVAVSWKACEGAEFYRVWRADSADGAKTALGAWQTALAFDDTTATAGTVHYYSVQAAVDETGTAASAFGGPAVGLRKISPKPVALTILGPDRVAAESTAAYTAKVRYENGAVASVVPVWSIASGGTFATIGSDGLLTVGKLEEDRTIVVTARFIDGATVEGSLEVALVAPIVKTATIKDVEAHARWPWNGWVDVDYTLETAPTGTVAKVSLSGYDRDHKAALVATTLAGDGARGATVEPGKRRLSWNLGADYPDFHASRVNVTLNAVPSEPVEPEPPHVECEWFVDATNGNDDNDGRSWRTAKQSIQAAIDSSLEGDTILVADGKYGPIVTDNKGITIRSLNGAESTVISGNGTSQCALLGEKEGDQATILDGFTVSDGYLYISWEGAGGAGIRFGTIRNCIIRDCRVNGSWSGYGGEGGGVWGARLEHCQIRNCSALAGGGLARGYAFECIFEDNYSRDDGGALFWSHAENCLLSGNYSYNTGGQSAGAAMYASTNVNCTIVGNRARSGGIVGRSLLNNCIIYGNTCDSGEVVCDTSAGGTPTSMTSCYTNNPGFVDAANGDYRLAAGSPCIDAGDNAYVTTATDLAGNTRIANGTVDIGCYEYGSSPVGASLADGLVAYWPFDGDARDASGNGNDGTVNGATLTSDRNGAANGAYHFDGNDTIKVADSESIRSPNKAVSIAVWLKPENISDWVMVCSKGTSWSTPCQYGLGIWDSEGVEIGSGYSVACPIMLQTSQWQHLVVTRDETTMKVYLNGVEIGDNASGSSFKQNQEDFLIGCDQYDAAEYYDGDLDDLAIWNRALTASEVAQLYAGEKPMAKYLVVDLSGGPSAESWPVEYLNGEPAGGFNTAEYKTTKLVLRRIEPGTFTMGSPSGESGRLTNETLHQVTLTKPYYIGLFEVTQKQYALVMGSNSSSFTGDAQPVDWVSWNTIRGEDGWPGAATVSEDSFIGRLRARTGLVDFDLPTEAQWEYACRAGTTTPYSYGGSANWDYGWYWENSSDQTHDVGTKKPNAWELYDMDGNVCEWCLDWYTSNLGTAAVSNPKGASSGSHRVKRGGTRDTKAIRCRSAVRLGDLPSTKSKALGFRLARLLSE